MGLFDIFKKKAPGFILNQSDVPEWKPGVGYKKADLVKYKGQLFTAATSAAQDWGLNRITGWKLKRCWHPQTCFLTGKQLWSKQAYYGERPLLTDLQLSQDNEGDPYDRDEVMIQPYWVNPDEFILWQLKK
jgi:hypothetical protein